MIILLRLAMHEQIQPKCPDAFSGEIGRVFSLSLRRPMSS